MPQRPLLSPGSRRAFHSDDADGAITHLRELIPRVDGEASERSAARTDATFRRALAIADILGAAAAIAVAQLLTNDRQVFPATYLGLPLVILIAKARGLYDRDAFVVAKSTLNEAPALFQLASLYALVITILSGSVTGGTLPGHTIVLLWGLLFAGFYLGRTSARYVARRLSPPERCLVLGSEAQASRVQAKFVLQDGLPAKIVAFLPFGEFELRRVRSQIAPGGDSTGREPTFVKYIAERNIQRVIIASGAAHNAVLEAIRYFKDYHLKISVLPTTLEAVGSSVEFDEVHGTTLLGVRPFHLSRSSRVLKRAFDAFGSAVLLLALSPVIAVIALVVKLDSPGPILFRQTRIGRKGTPFTVWKFRTMRTDAEQLRGPLDEINETAGLFKVSNDPRVTSVGRRLRRSSLDELPQLVNVLRGDMSLVGPRPLIVEEDARVEGWHRHRLLLKPGMTGAWQIMGHTRVPLEEMAVMDYLYIVNWSLWADAKILLRTTRHVLGRRGL